MRIWVTAMRWTAVLSCRLPDLVKRTWPSVDPDEYGSGAPYLFLGPASYVTHEGEQPIAITWRLETAMPIDFFSSAKVVAS